MSSPQTLQEKVVRGSITTLVLSFLGSVFAYLIRILYSRSLTIEDYGLFYAVLSLPIMFTTYLDLGFGFSSVYFLPKYLKKNDYAKAWNIFIYGQTVSLIMSVILSLILIILAPYLSEYYFKVAGSEILIYIFCIFLISFSLINGMIQIYSGMQREKYYASITLFRWLFTLVLSAIFILSGFSNIVFFAIAWSVGHLITAFIYLALLFYKYPFLTNNKIYWDRHIFKDMLSLAMPSMVDTFISSIFLMTVIFFLTLFKSVTDVGIYNIIFPLASIPVVLLVPLNTLLLPLVSHLSEGGKNKLKYLTEKIIEIVPFIGVYFSVFLILFPSLSVGLIFGSKWIGKVELSLTILSLGIVALLTNGVLGVIALGIGKIRQRLKITILMTIFGIPFNAFLVWYYGIIGAAISTGVISMVLNFLFIRLIKKDLNIKIPYFFYTKMLVFSLAIFLLIRLVGFYPKSIFEYILSGLLYTLIFAFFGYLLKIYDKKLIMMIFQQNKS